MRSLDLPDLARSNLNRELFFEIDLIKIDVLVSHTDRVSVGTFVLVIGCEKRKSERAFSVGFVVIVVIYCVVFVRLPNVVG